MNTLFKLLEDQNTVVRFYAATSLVQLGETNPTMVDVLATSLEGQDFRASAAQSLVELGKSDSAVVHALVPLLKDHRRDVREITTQLLVQLGKSDPAILDVLVPRLKDQDLYVRVSVAQCLLQLGMGDPAVVDGLVALLKDQDTRVREIAAQSLGRLSQNRTDYNDEQLLEDIASSDSGVREYAGIVLAWRDQNLDPKTVEKVRALRKDGRPWPISSAGSATKGRRQRQMDAVPWSVN